MKKLKSSISGASSFLGGFQKQWLFHVAMGHKED